MVGGAAREGAAQLRHKPTVAIARELRPPFGVGCPFGGLATLEAKGPARIASSAILREDRQQNGYLTTG